MPTREVSTGAIDATVDFGHDNGLKLIRVAVPLGDDTDGLLTQADGSSITRHAQHGLPVATGLGSVGTSAACTAFGELQSCTVSASANTA